MTRRFTRDELMAEIEKVRQMMKDVENNMDGQYELLEDYLSDLLADIITDSSIATMKELAERF